MIFVGWVERPRATQHQHLPIEYQADTRLYSKFIERTTKTQSTQRKKERKETVEIGYLNLNLWKAPPFQERRRILIRPRATQHPTSTY